jgi:hypothetical protein
VEAAMNQQLCVGDVLRHKNLRAHDDLIILLLSNKFATWNNPLGVPLDEYGPGWVEWNVVILYDSSYPELIGVPFGYDEGFISRHFELLLRDL